MPTGYVIRKNEYYDSVFLMRVARRLSEQPGVTQAAALMGTEKNKQLLAEIGVSGAEISVATPNDLILAIQADTLQTVTAVLGGVEEWLRQPQVSAKEAIYRTLEAALANQPKANLAVISVPGEYAAREARKALERGLNVFLFSSNVPLESELALKEYAREHGLIVMGPDCGTAIIGGVGIGFANVVRRGPIGVIGAAGTGMQEFTCLVHQAGSGISHAIGTGSRDLSDAIGGISALSALAALEGDAQTQVIAILSKPPGPRTLSRLLEQIGQCRKPVVTCFLGRTENLPGNNVRFQSARTLEDAAALAVQLATGKLPVFAGMSAADLAALMAREKAGMQPKQQYVRGIFAGGTFCYQAQQLMRDAGLVVYSNAPLEGKLRLPDPLRSVGHSLVDMGDELFTQGRPHPMIDPTQRRERILQEAGDAQVAVLLLDFILGYNASPDPAGDLAEAIAEAKRVVGQRGGYLSIVASVCGTEGDPQDIRRQADTLERMGVVVLASSAQAATFALRLAASRPG